MSIRFKYLIALFFCFACICAQAEQIELKNGTKFTGTIVAVQGDIFRVKTAYGEIQVPRSDLVAISFPDAKAGAAQQKDSSAIDESLSGTAYINRTGGFELTLVDGWVLAPELVRKQPDIIAAVKSADESQFLLVTPEKFAGTKVPGL